MPMVAAFAVIAAVAVSLWIKTSDDATPAPVVAAVPAEPAAAPAPRQPVSAAALAFVEFARAEAPQELPLDHGYTAEGLRRLAAAVAVAGDSALWRDRAKRLEGAAAEIEKDAESLQHADVAREAFLDAADWLEAPEARTAAEAVRAAEPLRSQKAEVNAFFDAVAARLERGEA
jgi:hypothetical protein